MISFRDADYGHPPEEVKDKCRGATAERRRRAGGVSVVVNGAATLKSRAKAQSVDEGTPV